MKKWAIIKCFFILIAVIPVFYAAIKIVISSHSYQEIFYDNIEKISYYEDTVNISISSFQVQRSEGYVYYLDENNSLHRRQEDDEVLLQNVGTFLVEDGNLYYCSLEEDRNGIFCRELGSEKEKRILGADAYWFAFGQDLRIVYVADEYENESIYTYDGRWNKASELDITGKYGDIDVRDICYADGHLVFRTYDGDLYAYSIEMNELTRLQVPIDTGDNIIYSEMIKKGTDLYYLTFVEDDPEGPITHISDCEENGIYQVDMKKKSFTKVSDDCGFGLMCMDDALYVEEEGVWGINVRMREISPAEDRDSSVRSEDSKEGMEKRAEQRRNNAAKIQVKDEEGERTLYWENPDLKDRGIYTDAPVKGFFTTRYSQVFGEHYYYLRYDEEEGYIIYRDSAEETGRFILARGDDNGLDSFAAYQGNYYVNFYCFGDDGGEFLGRLDSEENEMVSGSRGEIINTISEKNSYRIAYDTGPIWFYKDHIYFYPADEEEESDDEDGSDNSASKNRAMIKIDLGAMSNITYQKVPERIIENHPYLTFVDDRIIYGIEDKGKITLYSYDMQEDSELEILSFRQKKQGVVSKFKIQIDKDYIYCGEYLIPLSGGDIQIIEDKNEEIDLTYNSRYVYYIDKEFHVHRIDKKTKEDMVVSKLKAMKADATEQAIYVQKYRRDIFEGTVEPSYGDECDPANMEWYSCALYRMSLDGKNKCKLQDEVTEEDGESEY